MTDREASRQLVAAAADVRRRIRVDRGRVGPKLAPLLAHIEANLFDPALTVGRMKVACGVRDNSISSEFHAAIGRPPSAYIASCRMETAIRLLRDTNLEVWKLSDLLGYSSLQVFSRAFVRWGGMRPSAYRRKARRGMHDLPVALPLPRYENKAVTTPRKSRPPAVPVRGLLATEELETLRAQAVWDGVCRLPVPQQAEVLRTAARPTATLFEVVHQAARHAGREDRQEGVRIAELALETLPVAEPGWVDDALASLKARAWAWVGSARSLARDVSGTWRAFDAAERWLSESVVADAHGRVAYLKACALKRQGELKGAVEALSRVIEVGCTAPSTAPSTTLRVEVAILHGGLLLDMERPAAAIPVLREAVGLVDQIEDPYLRYAAVQTHATCCAYAGRLEDARRQMPKARELCLILDQPNLLAHTIALDGLLAQALGDRHRAERCFLDAHQKFAAMGAFAQTALAAIDLGSVCLEGGRDEEARAYAAGALRILANTSHRKESLAALKILRTAIERDAVTLAALRAARSHLGPSLPAAEGK